MKVKDKQWGELVREVFDRPEFGAAWQEAGKGVGTQDAIEPAWNRIADSRYHVENLRRTHREIVEQLIGHIQQGVKTDGEGRTKELDLFHEELMDHLMTLAAAFLVMGAMTGFLTAVKLSTPEKETIQ